MILSRPAYRDTICRAKRKPTMIPAPVQNILDRLAVAWHERAIALKAVSFALVGGVNTAIDFSVFWTTANYLHWPLVLANVVAWLVAVTFSYAMNSFITFGPESGRILRWRDYANFGASGVAGMVTSTATLIALSYVIPVLLAKLASILVSFVVNFSLSHFVVFRRRAFPLLGRYRRDSLILFTLRHFRPRRRTYPVRLADYDLVRLRSQAEIDRFLRSAE